MRTITVQKKCLAKQTKEPMKDEKDRDEHQLITLE
jgi:hypothetical protein